MRKRFILDTNVLLHDPRSIEVFEDNEVIIPISVLDELDKAKKYLDEKGSNARSIIRQLDSLRALGSLNAGVELPKTGTLIRVELNHHATLPEGLSSEAVDNRILSTALGLYQSNPKIPLILVTKDINLRVKCDALGLHAEDYEKGKVSATPSSLYQGFSKVEVSSEKIDLLYEKNYIENDFSGFPNQFFLLQSSGDSKKKALVKLTDNVLKLVRPKCSIWGITPRNVEQRMAFDLLLDPNVLLVTLVGIAGSGKTLAATAAALQMVIKEQEAYQRILISRPIQPMGRDLGFLPGPQPLDAKILTPAGWKLMGDLKCGDEIIGRDGNPTKVLKIFPKGMKKVYKVSTTEGNSTECCEDHLWYVQNQEERESGVEGKIRTTKEISENISYNCDDMKICNYSLPRNEIVKYKNNKNIIIPSYTFGALLGNGFSKDIDKQTADRISKEIFPFGYKLSYNEKSKNRTNILENEKDVFVFEKFENNMFTNLFTKEINNLELFKKNSYEKFIPSIYKYTSIENRLALLQGLMDTSASVNSGEVLFITTSKQLSVDLIELVKSLGGNAKVRNRAELSNKHIQYDVLIRFGNNINPFYLKKYKYFEKTNVVDKIKAIEPVGEKQVQCILVENPEHLYITDDFIVTHNTIEEKLNPWMRPIYDNLEFLLGGDYRMIDMYKDEGLLQVEPLTYIRGRSIPNSFLIVDEAQNLSPQEVKTIITRIGEGSKIVLTGDIQQIDNPYIDFSSNGLTYAIECLKKHDITGHVVLRKGERSRLATLGAEML